MKPLTKAVIATCVTIGLLLTFAGINVLRVHRYIDHGWYMPLSFRVQLGISAFILRFWWVLAIFFAPLWAFAFFVTHLFKREKASSASML